jgi:hypothetical protein
MYRKASLQLMAKAGFGEKTQTTKPISAAR